MFNSAFHSPVLSLDALRISEDDPKTSLNQHQSLCGKILPHFDMNNLSVALKLKKRAHFTLNCSIVRYEGGVWWLIHLLTVIQACTQKFRTVAPFLPIEKKWRQKELTYENNGHLSFPVTFFETNARANTILYVGRAILSYL